MHPPLLEARHTVVGHEHVNAFLPFPPPPPSSRAALVVTRVSGVWPSVSTMYFFCWSPFTPTPPLFFVPLPFLISLAFFFLSTTDST